MKKADSKVGESYYDIIRRRGMMQATILLLVIVILFQQIAINTKEVHHIVTPMSFQSEMEVVEGKANKSYAHQFGWSLAALMGNVDKRNVDFVTETIVEMMSPFLKSQMEETLKKEAQILKVREASQNFSIDDMMYSSEHQVVFIWGNKTLKSKRGRETQTRWTYEFSIIPYGGRPRITHFDSYEGTPKLKLKDYKIKAKPYLTEELRDIQLTTNPEK